MSAGHKTSFLARSVLIVYLLAALRLGFIVFALSLGVSIFFDGSVWPFIALGDFLTLFLGLLLVLGGLFSLLLRPVHAGLLDGPSGLPFFLDPAADVDASVATDADDLVVFAADVFEFAEHEQALVVDALTDVALVGSASLTGAVSFALSVRALKR